MNDVRVGLSWTDPISNIIYDDGLIFINMYPIKYSNGQIQWKPDFSNTSDPNYYFLNQLDFNKEKDEVYCIIDEPLYHQLVKMKLSR